MDDDDDDCLAFVANKSARKLTTFRGSYEELVPVEFGLNRVNLNILVYPAIRALSIPAASLVVDRVFSHGSVILRPHRGRMSNKLQQIASTILSKLHDQQIGLVVFRHTLCLKFIGSNCSFFKYERYNFYFVQLQCNWVPIIYAQYLLGMVLGPRTGTGRPTGTCLLSTWYKTVTLTVALTAGQHYRAVSVACTLVEWLSANSMRAI